ncbi:unnamed protein product [Closterium sp. Yama58-4]|nr:unnamed protein product [Closterium sp. Yama58-4]
MDEIEELKAILRERKALEKELDEAEEEARRAAAAAAAAAGEGGGAAGAGEAGGSAEIGEDGLTAEQRAERKAEKLRELLAKRAQEQAEKRREAAELFAFGQQAYGRGVYDKSVAILEQALGNVEFTSKLAGEIQLWLAMAYDANGQRPECLALYRKLESSHPMPAIRNQAANMRYIAEAPKLKLSPDEILKVPILDKDNNSSGRTWSQMVTERRPKRIKKLKNSGSRDYMDDLMSFKPPRWEKSPYFWVAFSVWLTMVAVALIFADAESAVRAGSAAASVPRLGAEEQLLISQVASAPVTKWKNVTGRRLQSWGGVVHDKGLIAQPLPQWLQHFTSRLSADLNSVFPSPINHVLVNEYLGGQGIMPHQDGPAYFPCVAILSLGLPGTMSFPPHQRLLEGSREGSRESSEGACDRALALLEERREEREGGAERAEFGKDEMGRAEAGERGLSSHAVVMRESVALPPRSLLVFKDQAYTAQHGLITIFLSMAFLRISSAALLSSPPLPCDGRVTLPRSLPSSRLAFRVAPAFRPSITASSNHTFGEQTPSTATPACFDPSRAVIETATVTTRRAALIGLSAVIAAQCAGGSGAAAAAGGDGKQRGLSVEQVKDIIARDISEGQYFVTGDLTASVYRDDCRFKDPTNDTSGLARYLAAVSILFDPAFSKQELLSIAVTSDKSVTATWRLGGYLKFPWQPRVEPFTGSTVYELDDDNLVAVHNETWSISPITALIETFTPTFGPKQLHGTAMSKQPTAALPPYPDRFYIAARYAAIPGTVDIPEGAGNSTQYSDLTCLALYSLYQQAVHGPCTKPKPWAWNIVELAKWQSWTELGKMAPVEAMRLFVRALEEEDPNWWTNAQLMEAADPLAAAAAAAAAVPEGYGKGYPDAYAAEGFPAMNGAAFPRGPPVVEDMGVMAVLRAHDCINKWVAAPVTGRKPSARYQHAAEILDGRMYVVGGNRARFTSDVHVLDLASLAWSKMELSSPANALPPCAGHSLCARGGHSTAKVGSTVWVFGGEDSKRRLLNDVYSLDLTTFVWDKLDTTGTPPLPRAGHTATVYNEHYLTIFGGGSHSMCFNDVHVLDLDAAEWSLAETYGKVPSPRAGLVGVAFGSLWFIMGGGDNHGGVSETMLLDLDSLVWSVVTTSLEKTPLASEGLSVVPVGTSLGPVLVAFGGYNGRYNNEVFLLLPDTVALLRAAEEEEEAAAAATTAGATTAATTAAAAATDSAAAAAATASGAAAAAGSATQPPISAASERSTSQPADSTSASSAPAAGSAAGSAAPTSLPSGAAAALGPTPSAPAALPPAAPTTGLPPAAAAAAAAAGGKQMIRAGSASNIIGAAPPGGIPGGISGGISGAAAVAIPGHGPPLPAGPGAVVGVGEDGELSPTSRDAVLLAQLEEAEAAASRAEKVALNARAEASQTAAEARADAWAAIAKAQMEVDLLKQQLATAVKAKQQAEDEMAEGQAKVVAAQAAAASAQAEAGQIKKDLNECRIKVHELEAELAKKSGADGGMATLQKDYAALKNALADMEQELTTARTTLAAEQARCFRLELAEYRQRLAGIADLEREVELLQLPPRRGGGEGAGDMRKGRNGGEKGRRPRKGEREV